MATNYVLLESKTKMDPGVIANTLCMVSSYASLSVRLLSVQTEPKTRLDNNSYLRKYLG